MPNLYFGREYASRRESEKSSDGIDFSELAAPLFRPPQKQYPHLMSTDEIMANIIAERVLGLPQEPRLDKGIPFNEVPTG